MSTLFKNFLIETKTYKNIIFDLGGVLLAWAPQEFIEQIFEDEDPLPYDLINIFNSEDWSWNPYGEAIKNELASFGFEVSFIEKEKKIQTAIKSAFLKTPTIQELLKIGIHSNVLKGIHSNSLIQIKVEIDTNPISEFAYEQQFLSQPIPVSIKCVNEEGLFAGKMHAALFRSWKGRVKGRDWYDMVWFIRNKIPLNLHLFSMLNGQKEILTKAEFLKMAKERIGGLNIPAAIEDIIYFVRDQEAIKRTWSKEFFHYWIDKIQTIPEAS